MTWLKLTSKKYETNTKYTELRNWLRIRPNWYELECLFTKYNDFHYAYTDILRYLYEFLANLTSRMMTTEVVGKMINEQQQTKAKVKTKHAK